MSTPLQDLTSTDSYDPATIECPWHYDAALREQAPVFHDKKNDMYVVSKHALINEVIHNPEVYSSRFMEKLVSKEPPPEEVMAIFAKGYPLVEALLVSDGETHERHRRIATRAFSRTRLQELTPLLAKKTGELLDKVIAKGEMEFFKDIAEPLPLNTLQQQLRIPDKDMHLAHEWSTVLESSLGGAQKSLETMRDEAEKSVECQLYFADKLKHEIERIKTTGQGERDDFIITQLAQSIIDPDDPMDMTEAVSYVFNLFPATNGTTTLLLMACMHRFCEHPDVQAKIAEDPKVINRLIEETMRHESPSRGFWRRTTRDTTLDGVEIPEGEWIFLRLSAAHRDESAYPDPDVFDIDRARTPAHLGFSTGIHMCAGRFFARHIVTDVLTQLLERASNFEFIEGANTFEHSDNMVIPCFKELHIKFTPKS